MLEFVAPVTVFALSTSVSPGPNNLMVTASGANFGYWRTMPHMLGITFGFPVMLMAVGLGMGQVLAAAPEVHIVLKYAGAAYLLYLAYLIGRAGGPGEADEAGRPLTFLQAALFQWVNPKAWVMAVGAVSTYTTVDGDPLLQVTLIAVIFTLIAFPTVTVWTLFGTVIARLLCSPRAYRVFNLSMAALLVLSLVPLFL